MTQGSSSDQMPHPTKWDRYADLLAVLGNSVRLGMVRNLVGREVTVVHLAKISGLSRASASRHLKRMVAIGIVTRNVVGPRVYCTVPPTVAEYLMILIEAGEHHEPTVESDPPIPFVTDIPDIVESFEAAFLQTTTEPAADEREDRPMTEEQAEQAGSILALLANLARLRMLEIMLENEVTVGDLARQVQLSPSAASQHLGLFKQAGFLSQRKSGQTRYCTINPACRDMLSRLMTIAECVGEAPRIFRRP